MKKFFYFFVFTFLSMNIFAQNKLVVHVKEGKYQISRDIYGHFSEHLGTCIYGGLWVGENSTIPNVRGVRTDVAEALKRIKVPNLRWPGGCFADTYHWKDGIGPKENRAKIVNVNWGGVTEDNSFGTHEFMDLCQQIGTQPYLCGNVGSGTVQEMADWVEYLTFDGISPMADLRRKNGQNKAWKVKFFGIGNEAWGCGGDMRPEYYADRLRNFSSYMRNFGDNKLYKIACGASKEDFNWTETVMKNTPLSLMQGLSLHSYFVPDWSHKGSATEFGEADYMKIVKNATGMEETVTKHSMIMDKYDPQKKIGLMVDEWGTWYQVEPGTNPGFLFQQNTMRDALIAAATLNIFNNHADRVRMSNIAQIVNVLQAVILTKEDKMVLTPTYHVYDLYKVHQDATLLPVNLQTQNYTFEQTSVPAISASASQDAGGAIHISLSNYDLKQTITLPCELSGKNIISVSGQILVASKINAYNSFENPKVVKSEEFKGFTLKDGNLTVKLPSASVVVLEIK